MKKQQKKETVKKSKKKKKKVLIVLAVILIILIIAGGVLAYRANKLGGGMGGLIAATLGHDENTKKNLDTLTFLALGKSQNLTDTIIVCSYDPKTQQASMLSIPRDTFVGTNKNKATAMQKINALYQVSPQKTLDAVNKLTGLNIKYYAMIDTKSLREVVDAVGGIYFDVPRDMKYDDTSQDLHIDLKKGYQLLDGDKAEQLLRFRHGQKLSDTYSSEYGEQDLGRMRTQRAFLIEAAKQIIQLKNVFKIGEFIDIAHENLETNIPVSLIKDYIPYAIEFDANNIKSDMLPGYADTFNSVSLYIYDTKKTKEMVNDLFNFGSESSEQDMDLSSINVEILNGSGVKANLTQVSDMLKELGCNVVETDSTKATSKTTIINRTEQEDDVAVYIKNAIGMGTVSEGKESGDIDFTIILGKDYNDEN